MTSAEIAKIANVSRSTVSRVINGYSNVPEATRVKVQGVIDEYGYTPNTSARILVGKPNNTIGIFLADICKNPEDSKWVGVHSPYNMEMLSHFIQLAKKQGYLTLIDTISDLKECHAMEQHFANRALFGGIFIGFPYLTEELYELGRKGFNVVLVDQLSDDDDKENQFKRANTNNIMGGYLATKHLLDRGHKNILHVSGDDRLSSYQRTKGYTKAMKEAGLEKNPVIYGFYRENIAYMETKKYLQMDIPTGIFVANDIMALGVMRAIKEKGLRVPEDISIIGFDNLEWGHWMDLQLTSMDINKKVLAECAINLLLDKELPTLADPVVHEKGSVKDLRYFRKQYN